MKLKRWIQSTIGLSSSEANAMMILLPSIFVVIFSEPVYRLYIFPSAPISVKEEKYLDSLVSEIKPAINSDQIETALFSFDPNVSSIEELKKLGIPEIVGKRIIQYRSKGGKFRIKHDLAKMYGLDSAIYRSLAPFILLPNQLEQKELHAKRETLHVIAAVQFDLNLTDTTSLKTMEGIGPVLSKRILKYRDGLGGFVSLNQLKEIYGLDSATVSRLKSFYIADGFQPIKIKINTATEPELSAHPYLSSRDAKSIITYRLQHGKFSNLGDLLKIKTIKESTTAKIASYLSFE